MKRTQLRELLVGGGVESPSKDLIDSLLDAFGEETESLKNVFQKEKDELSKQIADLTTEKEKLEKEKINADEFNNLKQENEKLKSDALKSEQKGILRDLNGDPDFFDTVLGRIELKEGEDFKTKADEFYKNNPKFTNQQTFKTNSNPQIKSGATPSQEQTLASAIADHYSKK